MGRSRSTSTTGRDCLVIQPRPFYRFTFTHKDGHSLWMWPANRFLFPDTYVSPSWLKRPVVISVEQYTIKMYNQDESRTIVL